MPATTTELVSAILENLRELASRNPEGTEVDALLTYLYTPTSDLRELLRPFRALSQGDETVRDSLADGRLLEQVVVAAFQELRGTTSFLAYRSALAQHDLVISGDTLEWETALQVITMQPRGGSILVEAKSTVGAVDVEQFSKLCCVMAVHLRDVALGVFFSTAGASGFPRRDGRQKNSPRDAWLCQMLFLAHDGRPVIVFDLDDIVSLDQPGTLPLLLRRKVREASNKTGIWDGEADQPQQVNLPDYLEALIRKVRSAAATAKPDKGG